jgi:hypothetical protein
MKQKSQGESGGEELRVLASTPGFIKALYISERTFVYICEVVKITPLFQQASSFISHVNSRLKIKS